SLDSRIRGRVVSHLDEGEALRLAGELVGNQVDPGDLAVRLEGGAQLVFGDVVRQVADIEIHHHSFLKNVLINFSLAVCQHASRARDCQWPGQFESSRVNERYPTPGAGAGVADVCAV